MSAVTLAVMRPAGRALVVASPDCRVQPLLTLQRLGFTCVEHDEPYAAMAEICKDPDSFAALILSLNGVYREELHLIASLKARLPHVEIWLTDTDGRQAALAEAMQLGADGLISEEGFHRTARGPASDSNAEIVKANGSYPKKPQVELPPPVRETTLDDFAAAAGEAVLTAEELHALLQDHVAFPPVIEDQ